MALPSYAVTFRGRPACPCLAEWLPHFERVLIARGVIRESLDIAQLIGEADASAETHSRGGAFDVWQHDPVTQAVGREMGAATWNRVTGSFATNKHTHGVLNGCPHNGPAAYQIDALADGYDGLGKGGRGGRDTGPGPRHLRTWREGIEWARQQEDDMQEQDFDRIRKIVREEMKAVGKSTAARDRRIATKTLESLDAIAAEVRDDATKAQLMRLRADVAALAARDVEDSAASTS